MRRASFLASICVLALLPLSLHAEELSKSARTTLVGGVVYLLAHDSYYGSLVPVSSGSGTVISKDGWILTNYHVVFDYDTGVPHKEIQVAFTKSTKEKPEPVCLADPESGMY